MSEPISMPDDFYDQTPDGDIASTEAVMNTIRTADLLFDRIGRLLRPLGVSAAGGLALGQLRDHGPMTPSELGQRLIVTRATVTGIVDSLERRGFARRNPHPDDRRSLIVELTDAGHDVLQRVRTLIHAHERRWMSALTADEIRSLISHMQRVQVSLLRDDTAS